MATRKSCTWLGAAAMFLTALPAFAISDAERIEVYREFLSHFNVRQYAEAQPLAEKLVEMTETQYGPEELALTAPLANLATVHFRQGHFPAAIDAYQRTLRILQAKSTIGDQQQIIPLHGLGVSFLGAKDPESAVIALKRAADVSRNTSGLYNIGQIEFIDALIEAYAATGRWVEGEKEALYALRVEEAAYGRASVKLTDRLERLAAWYEAERRYSTQRAVYERELAILQRGAPANDLRRVAPLRGMARTYRLEAFFGTEGSDNSGSFSAGVTPAFIDATQQRRAESALTAALAVIDTNDPPEYRLKGAVLMDLGDWHLINNSPRRAFESYAQAWNALAAANHTRPLEQPRLLAYRPSVSSVIRSQLDREQAVEKTVELRFTVDRDGRVDNVTSPTRDVPDAVVRNAMASIKRARYAPRIEDGQPVATQDVVFYEKVLVRGSPSEEATPPAAPAEEKAQG